MSTPLTCPFCNAVIPPLSGLIVGQRIACPRCGEAFAVPHVPEFDAGLRVASGAADVPPPKPVRANRLVGGAVLGIMALMAGVGLAFALATVQTRRDHDRAIPRQQRKPWLLADKPTTEEVATSPAQLVGLRYLPGGTGFVAALHVEELLGGTLGKDLREKSWKIGPAELSLGSVREWTGLPLEDIDHVVVGVELGDGEDALLTPPVYIVVRALRSDGANRMRVALKATRGYKHKTPEGGERLIYGFAVKDVPLNLWVADERTVVIGLFNNLDRVPSKPATSIALLPNEVAEVIEKRLAAGVPLWAAGHSTNWDKTYLPKVLAQAKDVPLVGRLKQTRTFGLWLVPSRPVKAGGAFRFTDESTARKATDDLERRARANPATFQFERKGLWVDVLQTLSWGQEK